MCNRGSGSVVDACFTREYLSADHVPSPNLEYNEARLNKSGWKNIASVNNFLFFAFLKKKFLNL